MLEKLQLSKAVIVIVEYAKGTAVLISLPEVYTPDKVRSPEVV